MFAREHICRTRSLSNLGAGLQTQSNVHQSAHEEEEAYEGGSLPGGLVGVPIQPQGVLDILSAGDQGACAGGGTTRMLAIVAAAVVK